MKRIGGLALVAVCIGVLSNCAAPLGLSARDNGKNSGGFSNFSGDMSGGGSVDSGVAEATATKVRESQASSSESRAGGGVLPPLGEFDRTEPGFQLFDPCQEVPESALERAAISRIVGEEFRESDTVFCSFKHQSGETEGVVTIASSDTGTAQVEEAQGRAVIYRGKYIPVVAFDDPYSRQSMCSVNLSTERGLITATYSLLTHSPNKTEQCEKAEEILVNLM
ncbi:DUF3558 domain-containing protein [Corynebacterium aurimucosum]|uniref:DUF3558 domain-containing protein n=2 Tax=Corynebacterium TaxID=1716 RepID=A0A558IHX1_9CORY|nr:DUF3558 domain-containing protein [Corynebacterium aurimucosum]